MPTPKIPPRPRTLVVHKRSALEEYRRADTRAGHDETDDLLEAGNEAVARLRPSHERHQISLEQVRQELEHRSWPHDVLYRGDLESIAGYDLVITVGGDGTVLDVSHRLKDATPLLGVNSDPVSSVGYFCATTGADFSEALTGVISGRVRTFELSRFRIAINGTVIDPPVLNDILIADGNPAATSRYILEVASHREEHRSSGIWVATPAGSTAAIRSAGGIVLPLGSELLQYLVREPYLPPRGRYNLLGGVQPMGDGLTVISRMRTGCVFLDGPHAVYDVGMGDQIAITGAAPPLVILGVDEDRRFA
ncbi:MAG: NAD(+) kinase [Myxococcales bacterium]|nr:NAD(+) kinase [Myxococcales bacterium]